MQALQTRLVSRACRPYVAFRPCPTLRASCKLAHARRRLPRLLVSATGKFADTAPMLVRERGEFNTFPDAPGVYAVYDNQGQLQYIGLSRKVSASVSNHLQELPNETFAVKVHVVADATRENLTAAWKSWVEEAVAENGDIPPGNAPGVTKWQSRAVKVKPEIRLTAGKPITGITIRDLIDQIVKTNKVVAFVKGSRTQPQCGFSFKMLQMLNEVKADYEVVNVLDEVHNPGLREAIKEYSMWPTIPQLYVSGEFVGGTDIVEQMVGKGELQELVRSAAAPAAGKS